MNRPKYIDSLKFEKDICLETGSVVHCYCLDNNFEDSTLDEWALHIRRHYVSDGVLKAICTPGINRKEFLSNRIPVVTDKKGPATISGEFAEIFVSDFREFIQNEAVFRGRWTTKATPTSPIQGCDVLSFVISDKGDQLIITESKSQLSSTNYGVLLNAVEDSDKDSTRIAKTLAFLAQQYAEKNEVDRLEKVQRFIKKAENPYIERFEGSGMTTGTSLSEIDLKAGLAAYKGTNKNIYFIYGTGLKELAFDLYKRALEC